MGVFVVRGPQSHWVNKEVVYPWRGTRLIATPTASGGQTRYTYSPDPDITNVYCRRAPFIEERPMAAERTTGGRNSYLPEYVLAFPMYYPQFTTIDRILVDDVEYGILAVECDGNKTYTRLRLVLNARP
jgi:hypothetical protein